MTLRLPRVPSRHVANTRSLLLRALDLSSGGDWLVVGGRSVRELPLPQLLMREASVLVVDEDPDALPPPGWPEAGLRTRTCDITGWTARFLVAAGAALEVRDTPAGAAAALVELLADPLTPAAPVEGEWAVVCASGALSQLHHLGIQGLRERWKLRFPGHDLLQQPGLAEALLGASRRLQRSFVSWLRGNAIPGGTVVLVATTRYAPLLWGDGAWNSPGWAHMLGAPRLVQLLDGWTVHHTDQWRWIVEDTGSDGRRAGKAYHVEGVIAAA